MMWMLSWMEEVRLPQPRPGILYGDNQGAVALTTNTRAHHKVKHIRIREHYIRVTRQRWRLARGFYSWKCEPGGYVHQGFGS